MTSSIQEYNNMNGYPGLLTGILIGSLAGAAAMLLVAPQSGEKTRLQIQQKGLELRDETHGKLESLMAQMWLGKKKLTRDLRRKTKELVHQGQSLIND